MSIREYAVGFEIRREYIYSTLPGPRPYTVQYKMPDQQVRQMYLDLARDLTCEKLAAGLGYMVLMSPTIVGTIFAIDAVAKAKDVDTRKQVAAIVGISFGLPLSGLVITVAGIKAASVFWKHLKQESSGTLGSSLRSTFSDYAKDLGSAGLKILKGVTAIAALAGAGLSVQALDNAGVDLGSGGGSTLTFLGVLGAEAAVIAAGATAISALWKRLKGEYQPQRLRGEYQYL